MSEKLDMMYDLVKGIDERQRSKLEEDAARHAREDEWRKGVNNKLEEHSRKLDSHDKRFEKLSEGDKAWRWLKTKAGKVGAAISGTLTIAYTVYRMFA